MGVNISEYVISLNSQSPLSREQLIEELAHAVEDIPGVETEVEQPIAHLISHMLSGVTAQIAIKIYGDDLGTLRRTAGEIKHAIEDIPGIADPGGGATAIDSPVENRALPRPPGILRRVSTLHPQVCGDGHEWACGYPSDRGGKSL